MYCLQWYILYLNLFKLTKLHYFHYLRILNKKFKNFFKSRLIPVLLLPKPINPDFIHYAFLILHLISFFLEKKPCTICSIIFLTAIGLVCYSCWESCIFWSCSAPTASNLPSSLSQTLIEQS